MMNQESRIISEPAVGIIFKCAVRFTSLQNPNEHGTSRRCPLQDKTLFFLPRGTFYFTSDFRLPTSDLLWFLPSFTFSEGKYFTRRRRISLFAKQRISHIPKECISLKKAPQKRSFFLILSILSFLYYMQNS